MQHGERAGGRIDAEDRPAGGAGGCRGPAASRDAVELSANFDQAAERCPAVVATGERMQRAEVAGEGIDAEDRARPIRPAARDTVERAVAAAQQRANREVRPGEKCHLAVGRASIDAGRGRAVEAAVRRLEERTVWRAR